MSTSSPDAMPGQPSPAERVLGSDRWCQREGCNRHAKTRHARYCSDACRAADWKARQAALDFDRPNVADPFVPADEREKLRSDVETVLARLRQGPATNRELAEMFPLGTAVHSRVSDARQWLERQEPAETIVRERLSPRLNRYHIAAKVQLQQDPIPGGDAMCRGRESRPVEQYPQSISPAVLVCTEEVVSPDDSSAETDTGGGGLLPPDLLPAREA